MKKLSLLMSAFMLISFISCATGTETPPETGEDTTESVFVTETDQKETEKETIQVEYKTIQNPVLQSGADPWVTYHEGKYYYCYSGGNGVLVSSFDSLDKISKKGEKWVYRAPSGTMWSAEYWAPELHYIDGNWYIYVAADDGDNNNHRMYVLKGTTQDPQDPFEMVGKITDETDKWAIDGTVVTIGGENYFVWSGWEGDVNVMQSIYIAHMSSPTTIDSKRTRISMPQKMWERHGDPDVNEGPAALYHGDDVFIAFSASGSWTDEYCIGLLAYRGGDPLDVKSWEKSEAAVFSKRANVAYGPGHCSFTTAADGSVWMVYHANLVSGTSWEGRSVWLGEIKFRENGRPIFSKPQTEVSFPIPAEE